MSAALPCRIAIIEDNPADVFLIREALRQECSCEFEVITNGDDAVEYLLGNGQYQGRSLPDLIVLDLNLPGRDGVQVLQVLRSREETREITVVVLSSDPTEVQNGRAPLADAYLRKPTDLEEFLAIGATILGYHRGRRAASP